MTAIRPNSQPWRLSLGDLPPFVKDVRAPGAPFAAFNYWMPERTGDPELDYQQGREHFRDAVAVSIRPGADMFAAYVVMAMYGHLGPAEHGFLDALLDSAQVGALAPRLTEAEMAAEGPVLELERVHESKMAEALACRKWAPDMATIQLYAMLAGIDGEHVGAAITIIARTALNGSRI